MTYAKDRSFADKHFIAISRAVKEVAVKILTVNVAPDQDDKERATDYIITADIGTVGCRIRRPGTWNQYKDLTIRYSRASGAETEYSKIMKGYPRWYLYGWSNGDETRFESWAFIDMNRFRESGLLNDILPRIKHNYDGKTSFIYYDMKDLKFAGALIGFGGFMVDYLSATPPREMTLTRWF